MPEMETIEVRSGDARLLARVYGRGDIPLKVVMIPSLGRSARDFDRLGSALASDGFTAAALDQRGIGDSTGPLEDFTLSDMAADVAALAGVLEASQVVAVGHAFGSGIVRRLAVMYPDLVTGVVLIATGGKIHDPDPEVYRTMQKIFDPSVDEDTRRAAIARGFFVDGIVPEEWIDGWWPEVYRPYIHPLTPTSLEDYWAAGNAAILVIQGLQDRIAPPENGYDVKELAGDRATIIDLDGASHALLPEQPQAIEKGVIRFLHDLVGL
jgi:pimeloyl-ACP methyl ester carboxylesterase